MSLTTLLVPTYSQMLRALSGWLDKAEKQVDDAENLLSVRLAPDMFPLATQVRFSCFQAQEATYRLRGEPLPESLLALVQEGQNAGGAPGSLADAKSRIQETLTFLESLEPNTLDGGAARSIALDLPNGMIFDMTGEQYARDWALPQFYFHLNTAYAILRNQSVELGKADYVAHALAYLRPETVPGG